MTGPVRLLLTHGSPESCRESCHRGRRLPGHLPRRTAGQDHDRIGSPGHPRVVWLEPGNWTGWTVSRR